MRRRAIDPSHTPLDPTEYVMDLKEEAPEEADKDQTGNNQARLHFNSEASSEFSSGPDARPSAIEGSRHVDVIRVSTMDRSNVRTDVSPSRVGRRRGSGSNLGIDASLSPIGRHGGSSASVLSDMEDFFDQTSPSALERRRGSAASALSDMEDYFDQSYKAAEEESDSMDALRVKIHMMESIVYGSTVTGIFLLTLLHPSISVTMFELYHCQQVCYQSSNKIKRSN
jgi:hypothetical protein